MGTFRTEPRYRWEFRLVEVVVVVAVITLVVVTVYPVYSRARARARDAGCQLNLRQLATALSLYVADYDGTYPRSRPATGDDTWINYDGDGEISSLELLLTYSKRPEEFANPKSFGAFFRCPADPAAQHSREASYSTNGWFDVFTVVDSQIQSPSETIYIAERRRGILVDYYTWWLFQPNQWPPDPRNVPEQAAAGALAIHRHQGLASYLYVDGHAKLQSFARTWSPECRYWPTRY